MTAARQPVTKRQVRYYSKVAREYLRDVAEELAKPEPDWRRMAELADEASGFAGQIASDIEDGLGDNEVSSWEPPVKSAAEGRASQ